MLVGGVERCARCGTLLRGGRQVCPSCGLDQAAMDAPPPEAAAASAVMESGQSPSKKVICPACMMSVPANTLTEFGGQKLCPNCFDQMKAKHERKKAEV